MYFISNIYRDCNHDSLDLSFIDIVICFRFVSIEFIYCYKCQSPISRAFQTCQ